MKIDIRELGVEVNDALHRHIEQCVHGALARFAPYILRVTVCLEGAGKFRPGGGIRCRVAVAVHGSGHVSADVLDLSMRAAIDRAIEHIAHTIAHDLGRPRTQTHPKNLLPLSLD